MKKIIILILTISLCFVFPSCTKNNNSGKEINNDNQQNQDNEQNKDNDSSKGSETGNKNVIVDNVFNLTQEEVNDIEKIVSKMTLEQKVGQMFFARCPEKDVIDEIKKYNFGGCLLFARDTKGETKDSLKAKLNDYQENSLYPMFIGVDEEGGIVNRVSKYKNFRAVPFWAPQELYKEGGFDLIKTDTEEKSDLLLSLGININFAPVCDISENSDDYIYARTFGKNSEETGKYVSDVVKTMNSKKIGSVLKHFPGYGNNNDTHKGIAYDKRTLESFENSDLVPFKEGIKSGAKCILVSHNIVYCFDDKNPASLSKKVHDYIRDNLNFEGVIITDDLVMEGITDLMGVEKSAVVAINSGNDLLCSTDYDKQIPAVIKAVNDGEIDINTINESVMKILKWKKNLGVLEH